jgi:hypothetical protein
LSGYSGASKARDGVRSRADKAKKRTIPRCRRLARSVAKRQQKTPEYAPQHEVCMNLRYLGDALDHWKGSIFESLQNANAISDFAADPMTTDADDWQPIDFSIYAKLLRITEAQVIKHEERLQNRSAYFAEIRHRGDLFLDPDTGVNTSRASRQHLLPQEIGHLLDQAAARLLIIYQHIRAQRCADRIDKVISVLQGEVGEFCWCSYESPNVAMLFLSREQSRVKPVAQHFKSIRGNHTARRIGGTHCGI